jgi:hypothetical protein
MKIPAEEEARRNRIREEREKRRREQANDLVPPSMLPDNPSKSFPEGYLEKRDKEERPKKPKGMRKGGMIKSKKMDGCAKRGKTRGRMC